MDSSAGHDSIQASGIDRFVHALQGGDGSTEIVRYDCPLANLVLCLDGEHGSTLGRRRQMPVREAARRADRPFESPALNSVASQPSMTSA